MKRVLLSMLVELALVAVLAGTGYAQSQSDYQKMYVRTEKNPGEAFLLSLTIPGAGQMYNGDVALGFGAFFGTGAIFTGGMLLGGEEETWYYIGFIGAGVIYLAQLIQAPIRAKQLNDRIWKGQFSLLRYQGKELSVALNPVQKKAGLMVKF